MSKKYFGTDGIRGKVNQGNINGQMFFRFGLAAGTYFKNLKKKKQIPVIASNTASRIVNRLGFDNVNELKPGEIYKYKNLFRLSFEFIRSIYTK